MEQVIGRSDDGNACPDDTLPAAFGANSSYATIVQLFAQKGFNERDLAALLGAHSTSRAFAQQANGVPSGGKSLRPTDRLSGQTRKSNADEREQGLKTARLMYGTRHTIGRHKHLSLRQGCIVSNPM